MGLMQMLVLPLSFLSGALYPMSELPRWLGVTVTSTRSPTPCTPCATAVFSRLDAPPAALAALNPPITWGGWVVPTVVQLGVVLGIGLVLLGIAIAQFERVE